MKRFDQIRLSDGVTEYPVWGMVLVVALLMVSPFVSSLIPYVVFAICLWRMIRYDARVFATDYCLLLPVNSLFRMPGGMALLIWLCLIAAIWYLIRGSLKANSTLVWLLLLLNYLITRMQMDVNQFVLAFGHMAMLYVIVPELDEQAAERSIKAFCVSLLISSVYALAGRNTWQLNAIIGAEGEAIWGTGIMRFRGLFRDPNYYMTLLVFGLALLCKMMDSGRIKLWFFLLFGIAFTVFGALTYSKTFFLIFILLICIYVVWQFWNRRIFRGIVFTLIATGVGLFLLFSDHSPFSVVLTRLAGAGDLSDITTGRTDVYALYWDTITENTFSFLFGQGLGADGLRKDPHNLYLEIGYYIGAIGWVLYLGFCIAMFRQTKKRVPEFKNQTIISRYLMVFMLATLYFSLHGMFQQIFHSELFLALLAVWVGKKPSAMEPVDDIQEDMHHAD